MVSRYDVAKMMEDNWTLLSWKGDGHAKGVYFNNDYGYLVERTYAVRISHDEPAPPVFYVPDAAGPDLGEVVKDYPYDDLKKVTRNYNLLFNGETLRDSMLERLFDIESYHHFTLPVNPLIRLLTKIPNKRERDRACLMLQIEGKHMTATVKTRKKEEPLFREKFDICEEIGCNEEKGFPDLVLNANAFFHAINLFEPFNSVNISLSHDKIKITGCSSAPKVEVVISLLNTNTRNSIKH